MESGPAICKICGAIMKWNTIRHLQRKHPESYILYKRLTGTDPKPEWKDRRWARAYCKKVNARQYSCLICNILIKVPSFGNVVRHIRIKHSNVFKNHVKKSDNDFDRDDTDEDDRMNEEDNVDDDDGNEENDVNEENEEE